MALDSRKYREYLHQARSHPESTVRNSVAPHSKYFYWSTPGFLVLELVLETQSDGLPPGIGFPFGFLLFWAFYFTYWQPRVPPSKLSFSFLEAFLLTVRPASQKKTVRPKPSSNRTMAQPPLPREIENALSLLGLKGCRDWGLIHKRYRELAKKFHPDLNPEITTAGHRFIIYDGAYRRLNTVKEKYFKTHSKN